MKVSKMFSHLNGAWRWVWAAFFLALPVTSFPFLPGELGGRALVRPLAIYPLLVLIPVAILPRLITKPLPKTLLPLLGFTITVMIGSALAFAADIEAYRGVNLFERFLRNLATLGVGIGFYLAIALLPRHWADLRFALRSLYAGMAVALLWGSMQAVYVVHFVPKYFKWLNHLQSYLSTRKLFTSRISGLTYEPKWFAEQICLLLLPWLLGSLVTNRSIFPWRYHRLTVELVLFFWACGVLVFTYSRTGLFILVLLLLLTFLFYRISSPRKKPSSQQLPKHSSFIRHALEASLLALMLAALLFVAGSRNPYFSRLWRYWSESRARERSYLEYIAFEQRFVYWATAYNIYQQSPWVGVGLGNYAFYFAENLPNQPYETQKEILRQITPGEGRDRLITPKNLLARLLAETGLLGTATFLTFLLAVLGCLLYLWYSPSAEQRYWAISGSLAMVVFLFVVFSFDSFALPNMWVIFGMITAAAHLADPPEPSSPLTSP